MVKRIRRGDEPRFDPAPLLAYVQRCWPDESENPNQWGTISLGKLGEIIGFSRAVAYRWGREGGIPSRTADAAACRLGLHPLEIWPDFYDDIDTTTEEDHGQVA